MKKLLSGITAMILVLGLFTTGVQAKEQPKEMKMSYEQVVQMVEKTDEVILIQIDMAKDEASMLVQSDKHFEKELDKIIDKLLKSTNKKVEKTIKEAAKSGIKVEPFWIDVEIGGRIVSVDPCRVVGF